MCLTYFVRSGMLEFATHSDSPTIRHSSQLLLFSGPLDSGIGSRFRSSAYAFDNLTRSLSAYSTICGKGTIRPVSAEMGLSSIPLTARPKG